MNYLQDQRDTVVLRNALRTAKDLIRRAGQCRTLDEFEILPGPLFQYANDDKHFQQYLQLFTGTYYHACGTCAMVANVDEDVSDVRATLAATAGLVNASDLSDPVEFKTHYSISEGVVDSHLRVKGVRNLRIADASVIPAIPTGPTAATCMVIADRAANFILQR